MSEGKWPTYLVVQESPSSSSEPAASNPPNRKAALHLGEPTRSSQREMVIPLRFTAPLEDTVGEIRAELVLPEGPWKFRKAGLPAEAWWKVSVRQRKPQAKQEEGSPSRQIVLELTVSAGSRAIPEGILGWVRFSLSEEGRPLPSMRVARLETSPPVPEMVGADTPFPLPEDAPINPATSCFFFTH